MSNKIDSFDIPKTITETFKYFSESAKVISFSIPVNDLPFLCSHIEYFNHHNTQHLKIADNSKTFQNCKFDFFTIKIKRVFAHFAYICILNIFFSSRKKRSINSVIFLTFRSSLRTSCSRYVIQLRRFIVSS